MSTYAQKMQKIFHRYQQEVDPDPVDLHDVGAWAINEKLWEPRPADIRKRFAGDMADALRQEYRVDEKGRTYRANHAVRTTENGRQSSFWADIDNAPPEHMEKAFAQRRRQIVGDCYQLRLDVDHFNGLNPEQKQIPLILDFTDDVEELLISTHLGDEEEAA